MKAPGISYVTPSLDELLTEHQRAQLRQRDDITSPLIDWLHKRAAELQRNEDAIGSWADDCKPAAYHVRSFKGARIDCDDIRKEIEYVLRPIK